MINAFTVDIEDWQHSQIPSCNKDHWKPKSSRIILNIDILLKLLRDNNTKATFFVLGCIAEELPEILTKIDKEGHEIGSHGYQHRLVYTLTPKEFEEDLVKSLKIVENIIHKKVVSFRAPYWSITRDSYWALEIIKKNGLLYDSSIYPIKNFLYGIQDAPEFPYLLKGDLLEFPGSTVRFLMKKVPFGGGFFLRAYPYFFTRWCIESANNRGLPCMVYIHPHELDEYKYTCHGSLKETFILQFGKNSVRKKLLRLLSVFKFGSLTEVAKKIKDDKDF